MEENLNQQKPAASEPPAPEITIRTMDSDIKAIEQGGGEIIAPQPFVPPQTKPEEPKIEAELNVPGYTGPEKPIFTSAEFSPTESAPAEPPRSGLSWWKIAAIIIGVLMLSVGLGLLGYYVIFPWIFPKQMPPVQ